MKKLLILTLLTLCVSAIVYADKPAPKDPFDQTLRPAKIIHHPLFEKVFPGVEFKIEFDSSLPPSKRLVGWIGGERIILPDGFNRLYAKLTEKSTASKYEKIETFLRMHYYFEMNLRVLETKEIKKEFDDDTYNYSFLVQIDTSLTKKTLTILIKLTQDGQIDEVRVLWENGISRISCPVISSLIDNVEINIGGSNVEEEFHDPNHHYYLPICINGSLTGYSMNFTISGLQPNEQGLRLILKPLDWPDLTYIIQSPSLTAAQNGETTWNWTPVDNYFSGICNIYLKRVSGGTHLVANKFIIPEERKLGTFVGGYDYTISFTKQFFKNHPNGIGFASTFAEQVEDALNDSWDKEVIEWYLCQGLVENQPIDGDENYQVYINDAKMDSIGNNYHGTVRTQAVPGCERKIGIGSRIYAGSSYPDETTLIYTALRHEFYHGIQISHNYSAHPSGIPDSLNWITEGQAVFIQSVFPTYNSEFQSNSIYDGWANEYLTNWRHSTLYFMSLPEEDNGRRGYPFCLFWRFLYETYSSGTVANKLQIIRDTCYGYNNALLSTCETHLDYELNGSYSTFDDAIQEFTKRAYFNDPTYSLWDPLPSSSFYATRQAEANLQFNGETATYTSPDDNPILGSFFANYLDYHFNGWQLPSATFTFNGNPYTTPQSHADFGGWPG